MLLNLLDHQYLFLCKPSDCSLMELLAEDNNLIRRTMNGEPLQEAKHPNRH